MFYRNEVNVFVDKVLPSKHGYVSLVGSLVDPRRGVDFSAGTHNGCLYGARPHDVVFEQDGSDSMIIPPCPSHYNYGDFLADRLSASMAFQLVSGFRNRVGLRVPLLVSYSLPLWLSTRAHCSPRVFSVELELAVRTLADFADVQGYGEWLGSCRKFVKPQFASFLKPSSKEDSEAYLGLAREIEIPIGLAFPVSAIGSNCSVLGALTLSHRVRGGRFLGALHTIDDPGGLSQGSLLRRSVGWSNGETYRSIDVDIGYLVSSSPG